MIRSSGTPLLTSRPSPVRLGHPVINVRGHLALGRGHCKRPISAKCQPEEDGKQKEPNSNTPNKGDKPAEQQWDLMSWTDESYDEMMQDVWDEVKRKAKRTMATSDAEVLDSVQVTDLTNPLKLMEKLATVMIGPVLKEIGVEEDPLEFFLDLCKVALGLQLVSCAAFVLVLREGLHYDAGEELRCLAGLLLGYLSRPLISVEHLTWPLYKVVLKVVAPDAEYDSKTSGADVQNTLNQMGVIVAVSFFLPQVLWGWDTQQCGQLVGPMAAGWVVFDFTFFMALLVKLGL